MSVRQHHRSANLMTFENAYLILWKWSYGRSHVLESTAVIACQRLGMTELTHLLVYQMVQKMAV